MPIPLTAAQVREEAGQRLSAAQQHALRMGWFYRSMLRIRRLPLTVRQRLRREWRGLQALWNYLVAEYRQARQDARKRSRAETLAKLEYNRCGRSRTIIPERTTGLGRMAAAALRVRPHREGFF
ncbi:MAG: hypothetical protein R3C49_13655 [Planctomycetaceae bacterium]